MTRKRLLRSKNVDKGTIDTALSILDGWSGKLTWDLLCEALYRRVYIKYTRQTLNAHEEIKLAYKVAKSRPPPKIVNGKRLYSPEEVIESDRNERLKGENERLKAELVNWQERYNRWVYNAYIKGLTEKDLEMPLPKIHR